MPARVLVRVLRALRRGGWQAPALTHFPAQECGGSGWLTIPVWQDCKAEKDAREARARAEQKQRLHAENYCRTLVQEAVEARPTGQVSENIRDEHGVFDAALCGQLLLHDKAKIKSEQKMQFARDVARRRGVPSDKVDVMVQDCENARRRSGK